MPLGVDTNSGVGLVSGVVTAVTIVVDNVLEGVAG